MNTVKNFTTVENFDSGKYLESIMDDSAIMCNEIIESYNADAVAKSYEEKKPNFNKF